MWRCQTLWRRRLSSAEKKLRRGQHAGRCCVHATAHRNFGQRVLLRHAGDLLPPTAAGTCARPCRRADPSESAHKYAYVWRGPPDGQFYDGDPATDRFTTGTHGCTNLRAGTPRCRAGTPGCPSTPQDSRPCQTPEPLPTVPMYCTVGRGAG